MNGLKITIFLLVIMHVLPIVITQLLIIKYPFEGKKYGRFMKWSCTIANFLLNGLVLYEIIMYSKFNVIEIVTFTCSYQDISRLATSNIVALAMSALIGAGIFIWVGKHYKDEHFFHFSGKCALLFLLAIIPVGMGYHYSHSGASHLTISEVCRRTSVAEAVEHPLRSEELKDGVCYVVITNNGVLNYELEQIYLSDERGVLREQESLQGVTVKPGETYQCYMLREDSLDISKSGGSIVYLSDKFGNVVDTVEVPALDQDQSYKSTETGWQVINLLKEEIIVVPVPTFSREGGFYDGAFELELTAEPGTTIYYTLDSSNPTAESTEYSGPIHVYDRSAEENIYRAIRNVQRDYLYYSFDGDDPVDKCFVVRAVAVDSDGNVSDIVTKSYFINQNEYKGRTVLSLVSDPEGLFDDEYGIYVTGKVYDEWYMEARKQLDENKPVDVREEPIQNYLKKGILWERVSNLEVFEDANPLLNQQVGIRVQGGSTRQLIRKRFSIYARDEYGDTDYFDIPLINDYSQHVVFTRPGDIHAMNQIIGRDRDVLTTDFIPVDVFLDGEYWYTTYLYEKINEKNLAQKYNLSKDNVVIAKHGRPWGDRTYEEMEAGKNPLSSLTSYIEENDLSIDEKYFEYGKILDIQSYIDWACISTFMQNIDYNETANVIYWHTAVVEDRHEGDARWRLGLYDMDLGWSALIAAYGDMPYYEANPFTMTANWQPGPITEWPIFSALRKNKHFCKQFVLTYMDLVNTNLSVENTKAVMKELGIRDETTLEFFEKRITYVVPFMAEEFELKGTQEKVTLSSNVSGAPITLNTVSPELRSSKNAFSWTGSYFTDYPVTVTANAPNFSHWEVTANGSVQTFTDPTIEVPVSKGGVQIHAVFE